VLGLDDDQSPLSEQVPELGKTLGEALLTPHPSYVGAVAGVLSQIKGMAHITGGGLVENVPRVLPDGVAVRFDTSTWPVPPVITLLQERSSISRDEMYRVFNMGLGMVLICEPSVADDVVRQVPDARVVGEVFASNDDARVIL